MLKERIITFSSFVVVIACNCSLLHQLSSLFFSLLLQLAVVATTLYYLIFFSEPISNKTLSTIFSFFSSAEFIASFAYVLPDRRLLFISTGPVLESVVFCGLFQIWLHVNNLWSSMCWCSHLLLYNLQILHVSLCVVVLLLLFLLVFAKFKNMRLHLWSCATWSNYFDHYT